MSQTRLSYSMENVNQRQVFSVEFDYACEVMSMLKINYRIAFNGIRAFYNILD